MGVLAPGPVQKLHLTAIPLQFFPPQWLIGSVPAAVPLGKRLRLAPGTPLVLHEVLNGGWSHREHYQGCRSVSARAGGTR